MLEAGGLDPDDLTDQGRRTLAWLAELDDPTVEGVADILTAARLAGHRAGLEDPAPALQDRPTDAVTVRLAALRRQPEPPVVGL